MNKHVSVLAGLLAVLFSLIALPASADEVPTPDQPDWLRPLPSGERWPFSLHQNSYTERPVATRYRPGNATTGLRSFAHVTVKPRVMLSEPWIESDGTVVISAYMRDGERSSNDPISPGERTYIGVVCENDLGQVRRIGAGSWNFSASTADRRAVYLFKFEADVNPCGGANGSPNWANGFWSAPTRLSASLPTAGWEVTEFFGVGIIEGGPSNQVSWSSTFWAANWKPTNQPRRATMTAGECQALLGARFGPGTTVTIGGVVYSAEDLGCAEFLDTIYPDGGWGTQFDIVCASPPPFEWLSFTWLPAFMEHYTNCLFVPQEGFPVGQVQAAISESAIGQTQQLVSEFRQRLPGSDTCGVIVNGNGTILNGFVIDTCSWSWAPPIKSFVGGAVICFAVISGAFLIIRTVTRTNTGEGAAE